MKPPTFLSSAKPEILSVKTTFPGSTQGAPMRASWGFPAETTLTVHPLYVYVYPFIEKFYPFLGDSITFTCILQRKLNLSHSFFSCCDRWSWGKVCILVECQLLKLCHHTSQLGFHFLVAFKRSVWNKLYTNAVTKITGYFLCNHHLNYIFIDQSKTLVIIYYLVYLVFFYYCNIFFKCQLLKIS